MKKKRRLNGKGKALIGIIVAVFVVSAGACYAVAGKADAIGNARIVEDINTRSFYYRYMGNALLFNKISNHYQSALSDDGNTYGGSFESDWKELKVAWYGDSLTELYYHCQKVDEYFNFDGYNCGIRGSTLANTNELAMCTADRMNQEGIAIPKDVDAIFIMAGTNDWCTNIPLGSKQLMFDVEGHLVVDDTTFYGACHEMFNNLTMMYPDAYILVMGTPFAAANEYNLYNQQNLTTFDYGDALCDAAAMWGIPAFNIGEQMGVNVNNGSDEDMLMYEGMHFVEGGARMAADVIIQEISKLKFYK